MRKPDGVKSYCALERYLAGLNLDTHLGIRSQVGKLSVKNHGKHF